MTSMWKERTKSYKRLSVEEVFIAIELTQLHTKSLQIYLWKKWIAEKHIRGWNNRLMAANGR